LRGILLPNTRKTLVFIPYYVYYISERNPPPLRGILLPNTRKTLVFITFIVSRQCPSILSKET
jgi:hypothetical protein